MAEEPILIRRLMERRQRDRCRTSLRCCSRATPASIFVTSPTKATPQAITDLIGGHLPMFFTSTQDLVEAHNAGRIRVLATSGRERSTASCLRYQPSWKAATAFAARVGMAFMLLPKHPSESSRKLNQAVVEAVRSTSSAAAFRRSAFKRPERRLRNLQRLRNPTPNCGGLWSKPRDLNRSRTKSLFLIHLGPGATSVSNVSFGSLALV